MRPELRKMIMETIASIRDAQKCALEQITRNNTAAAQNILSECQDTIIQLNEIIEGSEGEDCACFPLFEGYCRAVFGLYSVMSDRTAAKKAYKTLESALDKLSLSVENDIETRLEVVFMPYKAAMWDSLESIWKAADSDSGCDAFVIPIPYYDRLPDHSFGQRHYEGDEFPDGVPITHYDSYDLEKRRPDIIFFHNPYDELNFVTSVDPRFYSAELKKHTGLLVYVPYFVLDEISPDNAEKVKSAEHFCVTRGVINADKTFVQSEDMRKVYIKNLLDHFGDTPKNRAVIESKIEGTGSPKLDKVRNAVKNDYL